MNNHSLFLRYAAQTFQPPVFAHAFLHHHWAIGVHKKGSMPCFKGNRLSSRRPELSGTARYEQTRQHAPEGGWIATGVQDLEGEEGWENFAPTPLRQIADWHTQTRMPANPLHHNEMTLTNAQLPTKVCIHYSYGMLHRHVIH